MTHWSLNPGDLGSCTANALCGAFQYDEPSFMGSRLNGATPMRVTAPPFLYYNERQKEHSLAEDAGALLCDGIDSLCIHGICPEAEWPYDISKFRTPPPTHCYQDAHLNRASAVQNLANNLTSMKTCLAMNRPFVVGIRIFIHNVWLFISQGRCAVRFLRKSPGHPYRDGAHARRQPREGPRRPCRPGVRVRRWFTRSVCVP